MKKTLLRGVKEAERDYATALRNWGEKNQITVRAFIKYYELKVKYEKEKRVSKNEKS